MSTTIVAAETAKGNPTLAKKGDHYDSILCLIPLPRPDHKQALKSEHNHNYQHSSYVAHIVIYHYVPVATIIIQETAEPTLLKRPVP